MWDHDVLSREAKIGKGCFVLGCFVWLPDVIEYYGFIIMSKGHIYLVVISLFYDMVK